jgi:4-amino-4-deoxy-L-arabinose transferase
VNAARGADPPEPGAAKRRWPWIFALLAFAMAFQGSRAIWNPDEGRYTHVALQMLRSGDWLTPRLHPEGAHFSKPPLTYWAIAASVSAFGHNEWAVRLPNALAFVVTALLVARMARHLTRGRPQIAGLIYATSLYPFVAANIVTTDTLLTAAVALGMTGFVELWHDPSAAERGRYLVWIGFGLAFLTKGPPGLLLLAATLVFAAIQRGTAGVRRIVAPGPLAVFALLAFGWYAYQIGKNPGLLGYLLGSEIAQRVASDQFDRNAGLAGLARAYLPVIVAGALPWWPWAAHRAWRLRDSTATWRRRLGEPSRLLLLLWIALPLAVFCASTSRLPLYLLQLTPAASLAMARILAAGPFRRRAQAALAAWVLALVGVKAYATVHATDRDGKAFARSVVALYPQPLRELAFVEHRPHYAASFYLRCEMEELDLDGTPRLEPSYHATAELLESELREDHGPRLFFVPRSREPAWLRELTRLQSTAARLGDIDRFAVYAEPRRADADPLTQRQDPTQGDPP